MKFLDRLSKVAEIVGSLGIVISLFLVSVQYENNSLALKTSTANSVNANIAHWYNSFFENTEETESFLTFLADPESVSQTEQKPGCDPFPESMGPHGSRALESTR